MLGGPRNKIPNKFHVPNVRVARGSDGGAPTKRAGGQTEASKVASKQNEAGLRQWDATAANNAKAAKPGLRTTSTTVDKSLREMFGLQGKVALVTGGGQGIGFGVAMQLAKAGAKVAIMGRYADSLKAAVAQIKAAGGDAMYIVADGVKISDTKKVALAVQKRFGNINVLVNNAGMGDATPTSKVTSAQVRNILDRNVLSAINATKAVLPQLKASGGGSIINIESTTSSQGSGPFWLYGASKGATGQLTNGWAKEFAHLNIRVNAVVPGFIDTPMSSWVHEPKVFERVTKNTPLGRLGQPDEIGKVAVFLAGDSASFMTGSHVTADGGIMMSDR